MDGGAWDGGFVAVVPVKPPRHGKSRLRAPGRPHLAEAFALDTLAACSSAVRLTAVLVVTDDVALARTARDAGCATVPDGITPGLNATLRHAAAEARRRWPLAQPVALCADLPALLPDDLDAALGSVVAVPGAAYVIDHLGTGTTLYTAPYDVFDPAFGPGSAAAHRAGGARPVPGELASLRLDVDELHDLRLALDLGVGAATRAAAAAHAE